VEKLLNEENEQDGKVDREKNRRTQLELCR
jgi:hypothetical protein